MAQRKREKLLLFALTALINIGTVLGLNTFYFSRRHKSFINGKWLRLYGKILALAFVVLYPIAMISRDYKHFTPIGVTDFARISLSISSWLLCSLIYLYQTSNSSKICEIYNRTISLYERYVTMSARDHGDTLKLRLMLKCVLRSSILFVGFFVMNLHKYGHLFTLDDDILGCVLFFYLFLPSIIISVASNRFYIAATCGLYLIAVGNENLRVVDETHGEFIDLREISLHGKENFRTIVAEWILTSLKNHSALHQLFMDFNKIHAKCIIFIIGYCILNVIFQVRRHNILFQCHFKKH